MGRTRRFAALLLLVPCIAFGAPLDAGPTFLLAWGSSGSAPGQFAFAHDLAVTSAGDVFVADFLNDRVQHFGPTGAFLGAWAVRLPAGIAVAPSGDLLLCSNDTIVEYTAAGGFVRSWGGTGSGAGQLSNPIDVAVDHDGFVYVCDWGNYRVQKFTSTGGFVWASGTQGSGAGQFQAPTSIVYDPAGYVWVVDTGGGHLDRLGLNGDFQIQIGSNGSSPGQFDTPGRPCFDPTGVMLVPDQGNERIQELTPSGTVVAVWGAAGGGPGQFDHPTCVGEDGDGAIFVMDKDNARVQKFTAIATPTRATSWGALQRCYR